MTDIEIANSIKKANIIDIAQKLNIENYIELYGNDKAKIRFNEINKDSTGNLILVTSINPTPYGEGKTTVSIGLNDGLNYLKEKSIAVLREPSLGPVFGIKGGATGGGYSQVVPMEDINLHFTGDFHAITSANNLISAAIDNHLFFGNELKIDTSRICFKRCLDMNDRALRIVTLNNRIDNFNITAASEIMSVLCLSTDFHDLKNRLANILIAYTEDGEPLYARDLKLEGALSVLLKDAIKPNLVQSLEQNPIILHGGPFANIAHGCNSIIATKLGLKLADYVITEAGFGSDLGAEKFLDIKCRIGELTPNCIVIVATIKALKYNAGISKEEILLPNLEALKEGICNLEAHINNMKLYTNNIVVTLNKYNTDSEEEINFVKEFVKKQNLAFAINDAYNKGGVGAVDLAKKVIDICQQPKDFQLLYESNINILNKIETICTNIYHASKVNYSHTALEKLKQFEQLGYGHYPVCIAKTQYSLSDNPKLLGYPKDFEVLVKDANIYTGAGFIVIYLGDIMTMPGLSRHANYEQIDINTTNYQIKGLF